MEQITCNMFPFVLLNLVFVMGPPCCVAKENELCYIKRSNIDVGLCGNPRKDVPCCPEHLTDVTVTVYRGNVNDNCYTVYNCERDNSCCKRTLPINVSLVDIETLKQSFHSSNCFHNVSPRFIATSLPNSNGLELIVVSYSCTDSATTQNAPTISHTTQSTTTDCNESAALPVSITCTLIVISIAVIVFWIYLHRSRVNSEATMIPPSGDMSPQSNTDHVQTPPASGTYVNMVPPTYEQLLRHTNDGEYSEVAGGY